MKNVVLVNNFQEFENIHVEYFSVFFFTKICVCFVYKIKFIPDNQLMKKYFKLFWLSQ